MKKFHATKPLAFSLHFLFRRDQNHLIIIQSCKKLLLKAAREQKNFARSENFFTQQFLALSKTAVWTKTTLFLLRSSLLFSTKIIPIFFTLFISRFKNHTNWFKKGLLQYSSSSRKKSAPQYNSNSLNCKKNQEHRNIAPLRLQLRSYNKLTRHVGICGKAVQMDWYQSSVWVATLFRIILATVFVVVIDSRKCSRLRECVSFW